MKVILSLSIGIATIFSSASYVAAQTPESKQASVRPFNIPILNKVMASGSDARSKDFNKNVLPVVRQIVQQNLSEGVVLANVQTLKLEASKLFLRKETAQPIRVYFLAEGAGYQNTLGFAYNLAGAVNPGKPYLIFPNASAGSWSDSSVFVREGNFVDIGTGGNGWQLDFFLIANGAGGGTTWWWNDIAKNPDSVQHIVTFAIPGSPFLLIGFEDLYGGGDRDYNDLVYVVDIGYENIETLIDDVQFPH